MKKLTVFFLTAALVLLPLFAVSSPAVHAADEQNSILYQNMGLDRVYAVTLSDFTAGNMSGGVNSEEYSRTFLNHVYSAFVAYSTLMFPETEGVTVERIDTTGDTTRPMYKNLIIHVGFADSKTQEAYYKNTAKTTVMTEDKKFFTIRYDYEGALNFFDVPGDDFADKIGAAGETGFAYGRSHARQFPVMAHYIINGWTASDGRGNAYEGLKARYPDMFGETWNLKSLLNGFLLQHQMVEDTRYFHSKCDTLVSQNELGYGVQYYHAWDYAYDYDAGTGSYSQGEPLVFWYNVPHTINYIWLAVGFSLLLAGALILVFYVIIPAVKKSKEKDGEYAGK